MGQDAKGGRFHYYVCGTLLKKGSGSCRAQYIRSQKLEQAVIDQIKEKILTYDNLKELVCLVNEEIDNAATEYRRRLSSIDIELKNVNSRLERLYDSLETGLMQVADLAPRIQHLRQRQEQLEVTRWQIYGTC